MGRSPVCSSSLAPSPSPSSTQCSPSCWDPSPAASSRCMDFCPCVTWPLAPMLCTCRLAGPNVAPPRAHPNARCPAPCGVPVTPGCMVRAIPPTMPSQLRAECGRGPRATGDDRWFLFEVALRVPLQHGPLNLQRMVLRPSLLHDNLDEVEPRVHRAVFSCLQAEAKRTAAPQAAARRGGPPLPEIDLVHGCAQLRARILLMDGEGSRVRATLRPDPSRHPFRGCVARALVGRFPPQRAALPHPHRTST